MIPISFSTKQPHQSALDKLNFHSILCFDKKPKMSLSFRIWLIHFAVVFKAFAFSMTMRFGVFAINEFFAKVRVSSLNAWIKSSTIIIQYNFNWTAWITALVKITMYALHSCFFSLYKIGPATSTRVVANGSAIYVQFSGSLLDIGSLSSFL